MSGWTEEKRQAARNRIYQNQPWLKSTGAKTPEGKVISSRNAYKGGIYGRIKALNAQVNAMLREQKEALQRIK